jgi:hypothetical protein
MDWGRSCWGQLHKQKTPEKHETTTETTGSTLSNWLQEMNEGLSKEEEEEEEEEDDEKKEVERLAGLRVSVRLIWGYEEHAGLRLASDGMTYTVP